VHPRTRGSGDINRSKVSGGSDLCRKALWQWIFTRIEPKQRRLAKDIGCHLGEMLDSEKARGRPVKLARSRVAAKAVKMLFKELVRAIALLWCNKLKNVRVKSCTQKNGNLEGNMSRKCQLTGKKANNGFAVSHSHHRTHKLQDANLQWKRIWWPQQKRWVKLHLSTKAIKTLQHKGLEIMAKEAGINLYKL